MEFLEALQWRYATKKMNGQQVPAEKVNTILEAIRLAPTSMGLQPFNVLMITDPELKKRIQPIAYNQPQITDSSHLLVFAAWSNITPGQVDEYINRTAAERGLPLSALEQFRNTLMNIAGKPAENNYQWAARQAYIALGFALAAAATEGVDSTPMEGFNAEGLDELLGLKEQGLRSVLLLPLGYRDEANDWLLPMAKVRRSHSSLFQFEEGYSVPAN